MNKRDILRAAALARDVPAGRYFSVEVCDGNTYNVGYIGSRATGQGAGPGWSPGPAGRVRRRPAHRPRS
jgi:hypothetical protein